MKIIIKHEAQRAAALDIIRNLPLDPPQQMEVKPYKSQRSLNQNALLWMHYGEIKRHIGESQGIYCREEELHEHFVKKFLPCNVVTVGDDVITVRSKTSRMNTKQMAEYMDMLDRYCADHLGLYLTRPGDE